MIGGERDSLAPTLDDVVEGLGAIADAVRALDRVGVVERELLAVLRVELGELRRRVEAIELDLRPDAGGHSVGVGGRLAAESFVVVNEELDPPVIAGTYLRSVEDTVEYRDVFGTVRRAPEDCVRVLPRSRGEAYVREARTS